MHIHKDTYESEQTSLVNWALGVEQIWKKTFHLNDRVNFVIQLHDPPKKVNTEARNVQEQAPGNDGQAYRML